MLVIALDGKFDAQLLSAMARRATSVGSGRVVLDLSGADVHGLALESLCTTLSAPSTGTDRPRVVSPSPEARRRLGTVVAVAASADGAVDACRAG